MQEHDIFLVVLVMAIITFVTRALPFYFAINFKNNKITSYLGRVMPACVVFTLVVYSLRNLNFLIYPYGLPEVLAVVTVAVLHILFRNVLFSMGGGILTFFVGTNFFVGHI